MSARPPARLQIDWTRCDGHGLCAELLPSAISRDEWGYPVLLSVTEADPAVRRAVALCPALALRLSTDDRHQPPATTRD